MKIKKKAKNALLVLILIFVCLFSGYIYGKIGAARNEKSSFIYVDPTP